MKEPLGVVDPDILSRLAKPYLLSGPCAPLRMEEGRIVVAAPREAKARAAEAALLLGGHLDHRETEADVVRSLVNRHHGSGVGRGALVAEAEAESLAGGEDEADLRELANDAPVVRLVSGLFEEAMAARASDIHIEPGREESSVRFRIDGVLSSAATLPRRLHPAVISRIKVLSRLDIAERRLPQDGRFDVDLGGRQVDIRVSILPTALGERAVMRLLDPARADLGLEDMGLVGDRLASFRHALAAPFGLVLVTGPTGSGKTTSLYGALKELHDGKRNILTVEDPVEYAIEGIGQTQVRPEIDLTFAAGLRSILRQDPDIVMVGEIRDDETAKTAVQAALTGHLVLSTLHTNDAPGAAARLLDMQVESYLLASVLRAVVAQRLVRVLCPECRRAVRPTPNEQRMLGLSPSETIHAPGGKAADGKDCPACRGIGYRGRIGIFELLIATEKIRTLVHNRASADEIRRAARAEGMVTLSADGVEKIRAGVTSTGEVLRTAVGEEE